MSIDDRLQSLVDREDIRALIARYARGVDRGDAALVRSCFWDDAVDDHGFAVLGPDDLAAAAVAMGSVFESTMHFLGSSLIEVDGDTAHGETYCIAYHHLTIDDEYAFDRVVGFRILDDIARREGSWRFTARTYVFEWARIDRVDDTWRSVLSEHADALASVLPHWPIPHDAHRGRRDGTDLVYASTGAPARRAPS